MQDEKYIKGYSTTLTQTRVYIEKLSIILQEQGYSFNVMLYKIYKKNYDELIVILTETHFFLRLQMKLIHKKVNMANIENVLNFRNKWKKSML